MRIKKPAVFSISVLMVLIITATAGLIFCDKEVINTSYTLESAKIPKPFDGFKITLITDFHNGGNYSEIVERVRDSSPDIICIVGDLVSKKTSDYTNTTEFVKSLMGITQVYYTYGNHEYYNVLYHNCTEPPIAQKLDGSGVVFLNNRSEIIKKDGECINLIGCRDSVYADGKAFWEHTEPFVKRTAEEIDENDFSILMIHRAQYFDKISEYPFDLVLSGHLHGGQIAVKPIQKYILKKYVHTDKYTKGEYVENGHKLIISAGCSGEEDIRFLNPPEVVSVVLKRVEK